MQQQELELRPSDSPRPKWIAELVTLENDYADFFGRKDLMYDSGINASNGCTVYNDAEVIYLDAQENLFNLGHTILDEEIRGLRRKLEETERLKFKDDFSWLQVDKLESE